jgi:tetratricopeptide (TPR) repeat protein
LELSTAPVEDEATVNIMVKAANVLYHEEKWQEAIDLYSRCILRDNKCSRAYINRAQALIYLNQYPQAIKDCDIVLQLDEKNVKALARRALANRHSCNFYAALHDLEDLQTIQPNLKFVQPEIVLVRKLMKRHYEGEGFSFHQEETEVEAQEEETEEEAHEEETEKAAQEEKEVSASLRKFGYFCPDEEYDDIADFEKSRYSSLTRIKNTNKVNCTECHINYKTHPMMYRILICRCENKKCTLRYRLTHCDKLDVYKLSCKGKHTF